MILKDLLDKVSIIDVSGDINIEVNDLAYNSMNVDKGSVFIAVRGYKTDGHKYIDSAIEKGASVIVYDREDYPVDDKALYVRVDNSRRAMSKMASTYYSNPSKKVNVIGVTGTNGKTSTTYFIDQLIKTTGEKTAVIGTNANMIGDRVYKSKNTTPESYDLQGLFDEMVKEDIDFCAMEVSSHALYLDRVSDVDYNVAIYTNLSQDHLDFHKDMDEYFESKAVLFDLVSNYSVINIDDEYGYKLYTRLKNAGKSVMSYAIDREADIMAKDLNLTLRGSEFTLVTPAFTSRVRLNVPAKFMIYNALGAIGGVLFLKDTIDIPKAIESLKNVKGRFDFVNNSKGKNVIVDYSHSPDALENVLNNIRLLSDGRIITVFGCGGDRDRTKRPIMGEAAYNLSDHCILTTDNPRTEKPVDIAKDVIKGFGDDTSRYSVVLDRKDAIHAAIKMARAEDTVLISGKGHETYQEVMGIRHDFDDKMIAEDYLKED